uniref:Uncharacterized protein n=1 Tax=Rhodosorus marinus TaxID=101924 RepID=A0A7S0BLD3_9RHOD|mmetsp:Transcript_21630/g.31406  ORF Transcript_21630/g.31406 Transcript_21630/m.31406 type:complete len:100 (+) Transcript_21630:183-482(+)
MPKKGGKRNVVVRGLKGSWRAFDDWSDKRATSIGEKRANNRNIVNFAGNERAEMYTNWPLRTGKRSRARSIGEKRADALNIVDYSRPVEMPVKMVEEAW